MGRANHISRVKIIFIKPGNATASKNNGGSLHVKINDFSTALFWILISKNRPYYAMIFSCDMYKASIFKQRRRILLSNNRLRIFTCFLPFVNQINRAGVFGKTSRAVIVTFPRVETNFIQQFNRLR